MLAFARKSRELNTKGARQIVYSTYFGGVEVRAQNWAASEWGKERFRPSCKEKVKGYISTLEQT